MEMFPAAPGTKGQPPTPGKSGVEACKTRLHPCKHIGESEPARVMKMKPPDDLRELLCHLGAEAENLCGAGYPGRIREGNFSDADCEVGFNDFPHVGDRNLPLPWGAERHRNGAGNLNAADPRRVGAGSEAGYRFLPGSG